MGAVPGFCGVNCHIFMARKLLGQPDGAGDSPEITTKLLELAPFGTVPTLLPLLFTFKFLFNRVDGHLSIFFFHRKIFRPDIVSFRPVPEFLGAVLGSLLKQHTSVQS